MSPMGPHWGISDVFPHGEALGLPHTAGALTRRALLGANSDFLSCFEVLGTPQMAGVAATMPTCGPLLIWCPTEKL